MDGEAAGGAGMLPIERAGRRIRALVRDRVAEEANADITQPERALVWNRIGAITRRMMSERDQAATLPARKLSDLKHKARLVLDHLDEGAGDDPMPIGLCRSVLAMKGAR
ncbi:hypothetical protein [Acetobacter musti]|nr:hypothetical protein [Acetobacter musti]